MDKFNLVVRAARELARAVQENLYRYILAWQSATEEWRLLYDKGVSSRVA